MLAACLIAAFAIAAVAASGASALEWAKCAAKAGGNYTESNCKTKAKPKGTGSFELLKAKQVSEKRVAEGKSATIPFSGASVGGGGVLVTNIRECVGGTYGTTRVTRAKCVEGGGKDHTYGIGEPVPVECEAESNTGEAAATNKVANVNVTFKGCKLDGSSPCNSEGAAEGEVKTNTLKGQLGWINKSKKEVGLMLEPVKKHGEFAKFICGGEVLTVVGVGNKTEGTEYEDSPGVENHGGYDQIISPITPVNTSTTKFTQVYTYTFSSEEVEEEIIPAEHVENVPNKFEGKHISLLEDHIGPAEEPGIGGSWSSAGEEITNVNTSEEEGLIKA